MSLNPLGIGLTFYNNWLQEDSKEFIWLSLEMGYKDDVIFWTMGICGFGFFLCKSI